MCSIVISTGCFNQAISQPLIVQLLRSYVMSFMFLSALAYVASFRRSSCYIDACLQCSNSKGLPQQLIFEIQISAILTKSTLNNSANSTCSLQAFAITRVSLSCPGVSFGGVSSSRLVLAWFSLCCYILPGEWYSPK